MKELGKKYSAFAKFRALSVPPESVEKPFYFSAFFIYPNFF